MMRETDELLPTTSARIVDPPKARPRALALTLAVALCAASAIAGVAIPRSSGDGVAVGASSLQADATPLTDASKGVADRFAPPALKPAAVPKTVKKSEHGATSLAAVTKSGLVQKVDPAAWARECLWYWQTTQALPTKENKYTMTGEATFSNYDLIGMPSGICTDTMSCAFENCNITQNYGFGQMLWDLAGFDPKSEDIEALAAKTDLKLNLPDQIAFPQSVADVVDVVNHARKEKQPISVKTSGHSYPGSSTLAKSVNINMRDSPKYTQKPFLHSLAMSELPAVTPCDAALLARVGLEPPPACKLAAARGKSAVVRVGGGELWDDAYRGVADANYWLTANGLDAVEVMGGYAGTVSAVGGWMQGGGLSDGSERVYGFGADQVLELEMVLASGKHVKLAPSAWEDAPGFVYPKTTEVMGLCNTNVAAAEADWTWEACEIEVPWEDLWFAVRGGGGGSYGIVVAATYQLHKKRTFEMVQGWNSGLSPYTDACPTKPFMRVPDWTVGFVKNVQKISAEVTLPEGCKDVQDAFSDFFIDVLYDPAAVGISKEASLNCGNSGFAFIINEFQGLVCYNGAGKEVVEAWKTYWAGYNGVIPVKMQASWDSWVSGGITLPTGESACGMNSSPTQSIYGTLSGDTFFPEGHVPDHPTPLTQGYDFSWSALIPAAFFLQKNDDVHDLVTGPGARFHIMGGNASIAYDQLSPISPVQRMAGAQHQIPWSAEYFLPKVQAFYPTASSEKIVGGNEYNHIGSDAFGPLKSDHSTYCPGNFTHAEREEKCVSAQEFTWGTDTLKKLEGIKAKVDPHSLFQCQKCVGFKGPVSEGDAADKQ